MAGASLPRALRTEQQADADRDRVLDRALATFLEFGIRRASMAEIAKRAMLSPATLYRRFATKGELVQVVALREGRRFIAYVDRSVDHTAPAADQVVEGFVAFTVGIRRNALLSRLLVTEPDAVLPMLTVSAGPLLAMGRGYLAGVLGRLQGEQKLPGFDTEPTAEILARLALSLVLTPDGVIPIDDERAARRFAREHVTRLVGITP